MGLVNTACREPCVNNSLVRMVGMRYYWASSLSALPFYLKFGNWLDVGFGGSGELPVAKPVGHLLILHTHEVTEDGEGLVLGLIKTGSLDIETILPIANIQSCKQNCLPAVILQQAATAASSALPPSKRSKFPTHSAHSHCWSELVNKLPQRLLFYYTCVHQNASHREPATFRKMNHLALLGWTWYFEFLQVSEAKWTAAPEWGSRLLTSSHGRERRAMRQHSPSQETRSVEGLQCSGLST